MQSPPWPRPRRDALARSRRSLQSAATGGSGRNAGAGRDAEAPLVLYGFLAGRGALSAATADYSKASCWLWNVKCWDGPSHSVTGESLDLRAARSGSCRNRMGRVFQDGAAAAAKRSGRSQICSGCFVSARWFLRAFDFL